ncbi:MAG: hypothetical protein P8012_10400 [Desulfobacterales bacterium]
MDKKVLAMEKRRQIEKLDDAWSLNGYTGSTVRSTPHIMAIQFDRVCQIESLKAF